MTKEQLELKVKELTAALTQFETDKASLTDQLNKAKTELENINKPVITSAFVDDIRNAVYTAVRDFDFDNLDQYDYDFELSYDNRLELTNLQFNYTDDLEEAICNYVEDLFNIQDEDATE